jgi:hypothetical protein
MSAKPRAESATDDNPTACSNLAQRAEVKSTDARKPVAVRCAGRPQTQRDASCQSVSVASTAASVRSGLSAA